MWQGTAEQLRSASLKARGLARIARTRTCEPPHLRSLVLLVVERENYLDPNLHRAALVYSYHRKLVSTLVVASTHSSPSYGWSLTHLKRKHKTV